MILPTRYKMKPPPSAKPIKSILKRLGCVGFWVMNKDGGLSVFDLSGNENDGIFVNHTAWTQGKYGPALTFDSTDDYISLGTSSILRPDAFTIVASIKPTNETWQPLIGWDDTKNQPGIFANVAGKPIMYMDGSTYMYWDVAAWNTLKDGQEHIVVFTLPGIAAAEILNAQMFIDGIIQTQDASSVGTEQDAKVQTNLFRVFNDYYGGRSSLFMLCNRVLSDTEIAKISQEPFFMFGRKRTVVTVPALPPEVSALYMDLTTQIWTIKHAKGIFTKL